MASKTSAMKALSPMFVFRAGLHPAHTSLIRPISARLATTSSTTSSLPSSNNNPTTRRRAVTVANDTGSVPWTELRTGEKMARATQQTFNLGIVIIGILATGGVAYVLYREVFSSDSKTVMFNRAADRVRKDSKCLELLAGEGMHTKREIEAYGEPSWSRWARNRTLASKSETDKFGIEHFYMHFYVEGPVAKGTVNLHMSRMPGEKDFEYRYLSLDVPGQQRYYLENADAGKLMSKRGGKMFGVRWS